MKSKSKNHPVYTFHNTGNTSQFNPHAHMDGQTQLEFYLDLVARNNRPDVFVLDNKGREVLVPEHA